MAKTTIEDQLLTVKWIIQDEKIIRFKESDKTYDISDAVAAFDFAKAGVKEGTGVKVKIDPAIGDNGTVVFMTKNAGQTETKVEKGTDPVLPPEVKSDAKEMVKTIEYMTSKTQGVKFTDNKDKWYKLTEGLTVDILATQGIKKGSNVIITTTPSENPKQNERIDTIALIIDKEKDTVAEKAPEVTTGNAQPASVPCLDVEYKTEGVVTERDAFYRLKQAENRIRYLENNQQVSIEAQGAVERAYTVVAAMVRGASPEIVKSKLPEIKAIAKDLAQDAYNLIQSLKQ